MSLTDEQWLDALSSTGEAFDNDLDEGIGGIFGFSITAPDEDNNYSNPVLTASFERALNEDEPREGNGDYAKKETRRWMLMPFEGAKHPPVTGFTAPEVAAERGIPWVTPELSDAARDAVRKARQSGRRVVLDCAAEVNQELYDAGLISRNFRVNWGSRVAWPLTEQGLRLHDQLTGRNTAITAAAVDQVLGPLQGNQD